LRRGITLKKLGFIPNSYPSFRASPIFTTTAGSGAVEEKIPCIRLRDVYVCRGSALHLYGFLHYAEEFRRRKVRGPLVILTTYSFPKKPAGQGLKKASYTKQGITLCATPKQARDSDPPRTIQGHPNGGTDSDESGPYISFRQGEPRGKDR